MLVLARKRGEKLIITTAHNETIVLTIVSVDHHNVRIGIDANPETRVLRQELVAQESTPIMA